MDGTATAGTNDGGYSIAMDDDSSSSDRNDDDDSFKSAHSWEASQSQSQSQSLTESMMDVSASPLFRSAHSTLDGAGAVHTGYAAAAVGVAGSNASVSASAAIAAAGGDASVRVEFAHDVTLPMPSSPKRAVATTTASAATTPAAITITKAEHDTVESSPMERQRGSGIVAQRGDGPGDIRSGIRSANKQTDGNTNVARASAAAAAALDPRGASSSSSPSSAEVAVRSPGRQHNDVSAGKEGKINSNNNNNTSTSDSTDDAGGPWRLITSRTELVRPNVHCVAFNQDVSCVCVGTDGGFRIRTIVPPPPIISPGADIDQRSSTTTSTGTSTSTTTNNMGAPNLVHQCNVPSGVSLCQMLYGTSLVAVVRISSPRTLSLANAWTGASLRDLHFVASVKRVEMNRRVLCVLAADGRLHVFNLTTLQLIKSIGVVHPSDPARGIEGTNATTAGAFFALSNVEEESFVVCRCRKRLGWVRVYKVTDHGGIRLAPVGSFDAHSHSIARIAIGGGTVGRQKLATASDKGTVIRLFSLGTEPGKLCVLLRGSSPCAMHSIAFSADATRVASSSSTGTVHVFKLDDDERDSTHSVATAAPPKKTRSRLNLSRLLPEVVTDQTGGLRSYAKIRATAEFASKMPLSVAFMPNSNIITDRIVVLSQQGLLHRYDIDARGRVRQVASEDALLEEGNVEYNH